MDNKYMFNEDSQIRNNILYITAEVMGLENINERNFSTEIGVSYNTVVNIRNNCTTTRPKTIRKFIDYFNTHWLTKDNQRPEISYAEFESHNLEQLVSSKIFKYIHDADKPKGFEYYCTEFFTYYFSRNRFHYGVLSLKPGYNQKFYIADYITGFCNHEEICNYFEINSMIIPNSEHNKFSKQRMKKIHNFFSQENMKDLFLNKRSNNAEEQRTDFNNKLNYFSGIGDLSYDTFTLSLTHVAPDGDHFKKTILLKDPSLRSYATYAGGVGIDLTTPHSVGHKSCFSLSYIGLTQTTTFATNTNLIKELISMENIQNHDNYYDELLYDQKTGNSIGDRWFHEIVENGDKI